MNGLKLYPIESQVIVINCCRVNISPPTLPIGSDAIKVVSKVNYPAHRSLVMSQSFVVLVCRAWNALPTLREKSYWYNNFH
jgi:hypothetical protein